LGWAAEHRADERGKPVRADPSERTDIAAEPDPPINAAKRTEFDQLQRIRLVHRVHVDGEREQRAIE
jgi:hypothetical protein